MPATEATTDRTARTGVNDGAVSAFERTLHSVSSRAGLAHPLVLVCECANASCDKEIEASVYEYETVHRDGAACFLIFPSDDHYSPETEHVLVHGDRYWIVEITETRAARARRRLLQTPLSIRT